MNRQLEQWAERMLASAERVLEPLPFEIDTYTGSVPRLRYLAEEWRSLRINNPARFNEVQGYYLREWDKAKRKLGLLTRPGL